MKTRVIVVEFRQGTKKSEQGLYGLTETSEGVTKVFLNARQGEGELINTFFHEMAHVYFHWQDEVLPPAEEERIARLVGNVVEPCFRRYKNGDKRQYKKTG